MQFSIYDIKNALIDHTGQSNTIFVGPNENEMKYEYMKPGHDISNPETHPQGGGSIGRPYFAEFRIKDDPLPTSAVTFTLKGAKASWNESAPAGQKWQVDGSFVDVGVLTVIGAEDAMPYRIAFSDSKYKFFKAEIAGASSVTAFVLRG